MRNQTPETDTMDQFLYHVMPQLMILLFGVLLGVWGILLRRTDLGLERTAVRIGRLGAILLIVWLVAVTIRQRQLPMLNPGQLAFFLAVLVWIGQCFVQWRVDQRLFALLPLLGVVGLMIVSMAVGMQPRDVTAALLGPGAASHVALSLGGVALLLGCGVFGAGHAILDWHIRRRRFDAWFQRLPSLGDLDRLRRLTLVSGWALVALSLVSAMVWSALRVDGDSVVSHLHPMLLLSAALTVLVAADRFRWLSARKLAVGCVAMSALVLVLLCISVVEIFQGGVA